MESPIKLDPEFSMLWARLRGHGHLWHRTSLPSLEIILRDREIVPNAGQLATTYRQSNASLSRAMEAVSLFDFDTETESDVIGHLWDFTPAGVLIRIQRDALDQTKLLLASQVSRLAYESRTVHVPAVEALHIGPISASAFTGFILLAFKEGGGYLWHEVSEDAGAFGFLSAIDRHWNADKERMAAERRARGERTWAEIVKEANK